MAEEDKKRSVRKKSSDVNLQSLGLEMGKVPPQALEVEEAVLGAILVEPSTLDDVMADMTSDCFYAEKHKIVFDAMRSLYTAREPIDILTVAQKLKSEQNLEVIGGSKYLAYLSNKIGSAANLQFYMSVLNHKKVQRHLITASYNILNKSYDDALSLEDLISYSQDKVYEASQSTKKKDAVPIGDVINKALTELEAQQESPGLNGVPSGFVSLDKVTNGWQPSDLIILAARPSVGKTAFVLNIARNAAVDEGMPVAVFSLEMPAVQLAKRLMTSESRISADKLKGGVKMEQYEWTQLEMRLKKLAAAPLYIDDTPGLPVSEFRSKVKRLVTQKGVRMVVVDYLQLMQGPPELKALREQEVAAISRTLKATAKEMNIPIIALSQLSRQSEMRDGSRRRPQLSDLRESGSIEQDADMVLFIHRADYQGTSANPEDVGRTTLIIAKHRNGEIGDINLQFVHDEVRFVDMSDTTYNQAKNLVHESSINSFSQSNDSVDSGLGFSSNLDSFDVR